MRNLLLTRLQRLPFGMVDAEVLELDATVQEHVADELGSAAHVEVVEFVGRHFRFQPRPQSTSRDVCVHNEKLSAAIATTVAQDRLQLTLYLVGMLLGATTAPCYCYSCSLQIYFK
jgi:hypothetical protein